MADTNGSVTLPGWFVKLAGIVLALMVPWASWVTMQLATLGVRMEMAASQNLLVVKLQEKVHENERRLDKLETRMNVDPKKLASNANN